MTPMKFSSECARSDADLLANMQAAVLRGLPEVVASTEKRPPLIVAASGPSLSGEVDRIRELRKAGADILAIRGGHDFLISKDFIPDYALTVDPLPDSWQCFLKKNPATEYWIAAQCDPAVFEHLAGCTIKVWYPFIGHVRYPAGKLIITGGTTSGLRGLSVAYVAGYREFHLFGFDSCLSGDALRIDGSRIKTWDRLIELKLEEGGDTYFANGPMAHQAQQFQDYFAWMPDATFKSYGRGVITAILARRAADAAELESLMASPHDDNGRVSFIHRGGPAMASHRYRAAIPARELGASVNDMTASTLVFSKPQATELIEMGRAKARGQWVVADFCDDHFDWPFYSEALRLADAVTCPTEEMSRRIRAIGRAAAVIADPYEFPEQAPHCAGGNLLWFGHESNRESLKRIMADLEGYPLRIVSNFSGAIPWSYAEMPEHFAWADIVILPATETYKSANRAVEAIRQGCFVVAEPHPAWEGIPGIWIGNIKEGIEWTGTHSTEARQRTSTAQSYVADKFSPRTVASAWKNAIQRPTTSDLVTVAGPGGAMSI